MKIFLKIVALISGTVIFLKLAQLIIEVLNFNVGKKYITAQETE